MFKIVVGNYVIVVIYKINETVLKVKDIKINKISEIYENSKVSDMLTVDTIKEFLYENVDKDIDKIVFNKVSKKILKKYKIKG